MSRQLRFDVADSLHHVTNRGIERRNIVRDDDDRSEFVRLLGRMAARHRWRVFAWVLLDNHFHLFFRLEVPSLSAGMHDLESGYATLFNRRHERDGPLFQGRFHDVVVENETHAWELSRYVHLNPCRACRVSRPEEWLWGSYRYYMNPRGAPDWLDWPTVLAEHSQREAAARVAYKRFVEAGLAHPPTNPLSAAVDEWILGSPEFVKRVRTVCLAGTALQPTDQDAVIAAVSSRLGVPEAVVRRRGRHDNVARLLALLLSRDLLPVSAAELADAFQLSRSGFSTAVNQARERLERDAEFAAHVLALRELWGRSGP